MWTMQSQPRNMSVNFDRSRIDPSIKTASFFKFRGARTSRITGVSTLLSNKGTRVCPRFPDPPVRSTFILFSAAYPFARQYAGTQDRFVRVELRTVRTHL